MSTPAFNAPEYAQPVVSPTPEPAPAETRLSDTARTEAFSDGVFAIAITLLVLEVRVPDPTQVAQQHGLLRALLNAWPSYLSYLATFLTVGVIWLNHHSFFQRLARIDGQMQWWNLMLLLFVSFTPFPNALLAEYLRDDLWGEHARTATAIYALVFALSTVPWYFFWTHLMAHPELFEPPYDSAFARYQRPRAVVGIIAYGIAIGIAYAVPIVAVVLFLVAAIFYALTARGRLAVGERRA